MSRHLTRRRVVEEGTLLPDEEVLWLEDTRGRAREGSNQALRDLVDYYQHDLIRLRKKVDDQEWEHVYNVDVVDLLLRGPPRSRDQG